MYECEMCVFEAPLCQWNRAEPGDRFVSPFPVHDPLIAVAPPSRAPSKHGATSQPAKPYVMPITVVQCSLSCFASETKGRARASSCIELAEVSQGEK